MTIGTTTTSAVSTFAHTSGGVRCLIVVVQAQLNPTPTVSSVTYGGEAMSIGLDGVGSQIRNSIYYLIDPPSGENDVVVTYGSAPDGVRHTAIDIDGDIDDDPVGETYSNNPSGAESRTLTPQATSGVFISTITGTNGTFTAGSVTQVQASSTIDAPFVGANGYIAHSGGDTVVSWTWTGDSGPNHTIAEIVPTRPAAPYNPLGVGTATTSTSASFSHTISAGTQMVIVGLQARRGAGAPDATAVTCDGVAMTKGIDGSSSQTASDIWYILNPTAGSKTIAITWDNAPDGQRNWAVDLTGGPDKNDPIGATFSNSSSGDQTKTITPEARTGLLLSNILSDGGSAHIVDQSQQTWTLDGRMIGLVSGSVIADPFYGVAGYRKHYGSNAVVSWSGDSSPNPHTIMEIKQHPGRKWGIVSC